MGYLGAEYYVGRCETQEPSEAMVGGDGEIRPDCAGVGAGTHGEWPQGVQETGPLG